jgi:AsmA protein
MKILKYIAYALGALLVLLIAAVLIVTATFDPNQYKPQIVQLVKDKTGRTLAIEDDIKLKLFPKIGAQVGKVTLSERNSASTFAGVDTAQVFVALMPLLAKRVVVDEVRLDGLTAHLVKFKDGTTNFSDLGGGAKSEAKPETKPAPSEPGGKAPVNLDISGVRITNAHVTWTDETNGSDVALELAELKTGRIAEDVPCRVEMKLAVKGAQPKLDLKAALRGMLTFNLAKQHYSFQSLDADVEGAALAYTDIAVKLKADIDADGATQHVKVRELALDGKAAQGSNSYRVKLSAPSLESSPELLAVDGLAGTASATLGTLQLTDSDFKAPRLRLNVAGQTVALEGLAFNAKGKTGSDQVEVHLQAPKLDVSPEHAKGESATLSVKLDGAQRNANVVVKLSGAEGSAKALKIAAFTVDVDARQQDNTVKGTLSTPITGNLETKVFELPKIAADFTVGGPTIPQKTMKVPLSGWVRADLGKEAVSADLTTKFDQSNIKAKLGLEKFKAPGYTFDVVIDQLNVDKYLPPKQKSARSGETKPQSKEPQPEQPIDLSALKTLNLDGKLKVGQLQVNNIKAANVRVDMKAHNGRLDVNPLAANMYQGSVAGSLMVNANSNQYAAQQKMTGISIGPLLRDAANKDVLEGKGNVTLDVTSTGTLVSQLKRGLNGNARMELRDGAIKGIDLAGAVRTVKSKFGGQDAEGSGSQKEKTDFSELSASFVIKNGVAHNEDLTLKSPFLRVGGAGDIDIGADSINYVVKTAVVASTSGQGGKELGELKGLTIPVRVSGTFDALKYKVEFSQMIGGANKEVLKETAREALKDTVKKQLEKGQLKDLGKLLGNEQKSGTQSGDTSANQPAKRPEDQIKDRLRGLLR